MGDTGTRRRPPLRCDRTSRPEMYAEVNDNDRRLEDDKGKEDSSYNPLLIKMLEDVTLNNPDILSEDLDKAKKCFEIYTPGMARQFLLDTFSKGLEDQEFAAKAGALYGLIHCFKIGDDTVRFVLLSSMQKELEDNNFQKGDRTRFINAVFFLSELYYHIRFQDNPISVLGGKLIEYFRWLLTGDEREIEVLVVSLIINGATLKKDKPASYKKLMVEIRVALVTRCLTTVSKCWLLLFLDMDNNDFKPLPEEILICHMNLLGDKKFQKLRRVRPVHMDSANCTAVNTSSDDMPLRASRHLDRQQSPEVEQKPEFQSQHGHVPPGPQKHSTEEREETFTPKPQRWSLNETANRSQRLENSQQYMSQGGATQKSTRGRWSSDATTAGIGVNRNERRIPVWQHEHDDRFDRDYK